MVYLKKKAKKRPTLEQIRYQALKALTKACKLIKSQYIMKLVRKTKKGKDSGVDNIELIQNLDRLKAFSHITCGERLTKGVFGEFIPPLQDEAGRKIEETITKNKKIIECKTEWINRLKDVHNVMERQNKAAQAKQASDLRKQGLRQDVYGGMHEIRHRNESLQETSKGVHGPERKSKRFREEMNTCSDEFDNDEEIRTRSRRRGSPVVKEEGWRKANSAKTQEVSVRGKMRTIINGPSIEDARTMEKGGPTCGNDEKVMEGRCKDKKVTAVIHPSWAAK